MPMHIPPPPVDDGYVIPPPPPPSFHTKPLAIVDTECYPNVWMFKALIVATGEIVGAIMRDGETLDISTVMGVLRDYTVVTFNGIGYDMPMIALALAGADCMALKKANDQIIVGGTKYWDFYNAYNLTCPSDDHIDIKEPAPGVMISLKKYGARLHSKRLQDLPYDPANPLTEEQIAHVWYYCDNDLRTTHDLLNAIRDRLELRAAIGAEYGVDVRSKSDAQIAEAVYKAQLPNKVYPEKWTHGETFHYEAPPFIHFHTPQLQAMLATLWGATFTVSDAAQTASGFDDNGNEIKTGVIMPDEVKKAVIEIDGLRYKMGIGGLHSQEQSVYHIAAEGEVIDDADVASYYPQTILTCGIFPRPIGPVWIEMYRKIFNQRIRAKRQAQHYEAQAETAKAEGRVKDCEIYKAWAKKWKLVADVYKIILNGTFGKLGSKYSILFAPDHMIKTTITGQLSLLMLIEQLSAAGIRVISANTDGIVIKCQASMLWLRDEIIRQWQAATGYEMETNRYRALYSRDVNNYIAIKPDGKVKTKGVYADPGMTKDPASAICLIAARDYILTGKHPVETIRECRDITKFITVKRVAGGAVKSGQYLGKEVRWYYAQGETGCIVYHKDGRRVADSEGARPMMEFVDAFPSDIDYDWYIRKAYVALNDLGLT